MLLEKVLNDMGKTLISCVQIFTLFSIIKFQVELELPEHSFQQNTEVHWLRLGPAIKRMLGQWDAIVYFVMELAKDSARSPKSAHYKRVYMMLGTKEKDVTRLTLEFLNDIIPVFEKFLLPVQKSSPVIHVVYDSLCDILLKLMRRFLKP